MKKYISPLFLTLIFTTTIKAGIKPDSIVGLYLCQDPYSGELSQVEIIKTENDTYEGRVVWVENEVHKDTIGLLFLTNLKFDSKTNEWIKGNIKYPSHKGHYKTYMSFSEPNKLKVRAYWGLSMIGKTLYWTKEYKKRI